MLSLFRLSKYYSGRSLHEILFATLAKIPGIIMKWAFLYNELMFQLGSLENLYGFLSGEKNNSYLFGLLEYP